ncbi:MAG: diadenylate cyclase [Bacilli bacterium]|nr:diadenylate cyclase [Bacilli bacterium]
MEFIFNNGTPIGNIILTLCLLAVIFAALFYCVYKVIKRRVPYIIFGCCAFLILFGYLFCLPVITYIAIAVLAVGLILSLFINLGDLRKFLANPFQVKQAKNTAFKVEKIFDKEAMYKQIETAVISLSKTRTGAIITFEKNTSLTDLMKNGVTIKAPVSAELLQTIFYPGTRLHDGAVVIHGNEIVAASVFYTPTTKAFAGKYGSRHRAALGISEISDSITVVVSEETGRISFAVNGSLETVDQANFLRVFENLMDDTNK